MLLLRLLNAVFAAGVLTPASDNIDLKTDNQVLKQNVDNSMWYIGRIGRVGDWETARLSGSPDQQSRSGINDITEDLQEQIDALRKKIKDLEKKEQDATSKPDMIAVQSVLRHLQADLQALYKKMDQLDQSQKQHFKQAIDQLNVEMIKMEIDLSDRITALDEDIQKTRINTVIGSIKDGQLETAAQLVKTVQDAHIHIEHIISQVYKDRDPKSCSNVLKFIELIDLKPGNASWIDITSEGKVKSYALKTVFRKLSNYMFYPGMSECVFRLAWESNELDRQSSVLCFEECYLNARSVLFGLPSSVRYLLQETISIRKDSKACQNVDKNILGDYQEWKSDSRSTQAEGGEYFYLKDRFSNTFLGGDGSRVYLGTNDYDVKGLWKPILKSNGKLQFQHKVSGKYLSYENVGSCYKYVLSDKPHDWYISV